MLLRAFYLFAFSCGSSRLRCDGRVYLKGLRSKPPFVRYRQTRSCKVKPPLSKFLVMPLIKKNLDFLCENCYSSIWIKVLLVLTFLCNWRFLPQSNYFNYKCFIKFFVWWWLMRMRTILINLLGGYFSTNNSNLSKKIALTFYWLDIYWLSSSSKYTDCNCNDLTSDLKLFTFVTLFTM